MVSSKLFCFFSLLLHASQPNLHLRDKSLCSISHPSHVGDGISEDSPLRRESSQRMYGSCVDRLECVGENDCKIGEVGVRKLVLVDSVRCGTARDVTRGWQIILGHRGVQILSRSALSHACSRERICTCCVSGCSVHTSRRLAGSLSPGNRNWS